MNRTVFVLVALCAGVCLADIPMREVVFPAGEVPAQNPRIERAGGVITHVEVFGPFDTQEDGSVKTTVIESAGDIPNASLPKFVESAQVRLSVLPKWEDIAASYSNRVSILSVALASATNRAEIAEARAARLDALRAYLVEQRDKAVLQTTKAIYQALIDRIDAGGGK